MFTIQYTAVNGEQRLQKFDSKNRHSLAKHLSRFNRPILAVYEQATVITKAMRTEMSRMPEGMLSRDAREFVSSHL